MRIAVFGLGYVGCVACCCIAKQGHSVIGVDVSETKVALINDSTAPVFEPGLDSLLKEGRDNGLIEATTNVVGSIDNRSLVIVCVGTPGSPDGSHDMAQIIDVTEQIAQEIDKTRDPPLTIAYRSTLAPGTFERIILPIFRSYLGDDGMRAVELVYNPEFLRETSAVDDYFNPPKIVVGTPDGNPSQNMDTLYKGINAKFFNTKYKEAELTKLVDNTWHAVKIAYANEVGRVCRKLNVSARKIHEIFVSDTVLNISANYTRPGNAFGGACIPKDVRAFQHIAAEVGAKTQLIDSLIHSNETHKQFQFDYVARNLSAGAKILLAGLAFKANTDDMRESQNLDLARRLLDVGFDLKVYDPAIDATRLLGQNMTYALDHLPTLRAHLVDRATAERDKFDLVIAGNATVNDLSLDAANIISIDTLP